MSALETLISILKSSPPVFRRGGRVADGEVEHSDRAN